ncbi:MAG TPA: hypothetical protein VKR55_05445 [Bradyrhizobium sp.]|uniref:hypothetical protein n=1 Tax=Bradyrhizobium sp. TaxID=376 RepID=UPI002C613056|nr:hypothetical protein [Bradyrhizobium sp.]HLZ01583.1 hypothetical protein [Bradyrhizobium sp.]
MPALHRRQLLVFGAAAVASALLDRNVLAQRINQAGSQDTGDAAVTFTYRGFTVDATAAKDARNLTAIETSLKHQIDIVSDCGVAPKILTFFKSEEIFVKPGQGDGGGRFSSKNKGVSVDIAVDAPEKPVLLHELVHAYHWYVIPDGFRNADLLTFYQRAREGGFYQPGAYVLKNVQEFFAVTGSLYLWGNVDRPPHNRKTLHDNQPVYYKWLGDLFGVVKAV